MDPRRKILAEAWVDPYVLGPIWNKKAFYTSDISTKQMIGGRFSHDLPHLVPPFGNPSSASLRHPLSPKERDIKTGAIENGSTRGGEWTDTEGKHPAEGRISVAVSLHVGCNPSCVFSKAIHAKKREVRIPHYRYLRPPISVILLLHRYLLEIECKQGGEGC